MAHKKWLCALCALPVLAMGPVSQGLASIQEIRNSEPIKVERHSSRWKYPNEIILGPGQQLHIVVKGDTLWDLGQKYLGNPYAWPQIWELNKWVEDPHWIYPGDPLVIPSDRYALGLDGPDPNVADLRPDSRIRVTPSGGAFGYVYAFQDFLQLPYLVPKGARTHFKELKAIRITGYQKEDRNILSKGDVIYLGGGQNSGLLVGDRLLVLKVAKSRLVHPDDKRGVSMGDVIQHVAIVRVLSIHPKNAEAVIENTLDGVEVGDHVTAFAEPTLIHSKDAPLREDILEPIPLKTTAKIIYGRNGATYFSTGSLVLIDKGIHAGLKVGDVLLTLRDSSLINEGLDPQGGRGGARTNRYLGQILVVRADETHSTCLVLTTKSEMTLGDTVTN